MSGILSKRGIVERICLRDIRIMYIYPHIHSETIMLECYQLKQSCSKIYMSSNGNKGG